MRHDSKLEAKLEPTLLGALQLDLARVAESERVELKRGGAGQGDSILEVPGRGYKGGPLEIAWCKQGDGSQLISPEAMWIFTVFRRLRRLLGRGYSLAIDCPDYYWDDVRKRREITPGVLAWWSHEE